MPDVTDCAAVTDSHLSAITGTMIISDVAPLTLQSGDFAGLSGLENVCLNLNNLSTLPADVFDGLTGLKELYPYNNNLTALPEGIFDDLGRLEKLNLGYNSIATLRADAFDGLSELRELHLEHNDLASLPDGLFDGLTNLTPLNLVANDLQSLLSGTFSGLGSLQTLRLSGNPGAPFTFTAALSEPETGKVTVTVVEGAPVDMTVTLSASGGTLSATTVTIQGGETASDAVTVTQDGSEAVTVSVESVAFDSTAVLEGLQTGQGEDLELADSTPEVTTASVEARPNSPATGAPTISGTAQVGETLTLDVSGVADADGLANATFSYQWVANDGSTDADISGATGSSYVLSDSDTGKTIKVRVSFTDDAGNEESLGSEATATVANPIAGICDRTERVQDAILGMLNGVDDCADVTGSHLAGITLGLSISKGLYDRQALSLESGDFAGLVNIEHLAIYNHTMDALPEDIFDGLGSLESLDLSNNEIAALPEDVFDGLGNLRSLRLDSNDLASPPEDVFDGLDSLTHLILSTNRIHTLPEDVFEGLGNLTYLSLASNPGTPFTLTANLERQGDNAVLVKVAEGVPFDMAVTLSATGGTLSAASVTIEGGTAGSEAVTATRSSDGPVTVSVAWAVFQAGNYLGIQTGLGEPLILGGDAVGGNHPATGAPAISGTAQVGETLTADTSGIADEDGLDNVSYSYQWLSSRDTEIDGATGSTYTLQATDLGKIIKVRVTFTDDAGNEETLTSAATDAVEARPNSPATGAPTISGTAQVGETLTVDTSGISDADGVTNAEFAYRWQADGADISGATDSTYTLVDADEGTALIVRLSFTDDAGHEETLTSAATAAVEPKPNTPATGAPAISGTAQVGETLTADTSGISDADGLTNVAYSYQWLSSRDTEIDGATSSTYTPQASDNGKTIKV